jgi:hypothetical protein
MSKLQYIAALIIFSLCITRANSQDIWLSDSSVAVTDSILGVQQMDSVKDNVRVFMAGENHTYWSSNNTIELSMIKYLHQKKGVRHVVIELGYARGYILDHFINDDSSYYNLLDNNTAYQYLTFYQELRAFNQTLLADQRLHVHGVDVERFPDDAPILLSHLLKKDTTVPASIEFLKEVIHSYAAYSKTRYSNYYYQDTDFDNDIDDGYYVDENTFMDNKVIDSILSEYDRNKPVFHQYLGADSVVFKKTIESVKDYRTYLKYSNMPHQYIYRERYMFNNMMNLLNADSTSKFYGQFGRCHVSQKKLENECDWWDNSALAKRLNESKYKNQLLSIGIFYTNYPNYLSYSDNFNNYELNDAVQQYIDSAGSDKFKLVKIASTDSLLNPLYNYLLLVNSCEVYCSDEVFQEHDLVALDFNYGQAQYNFKTLNTGLTGDSLPGFNQMVKYFSFSVFSSTDKVVNVFDIRIQQRQRISNGNIHYTMGGYSILEGIGYNPSFSKYIAIAPYVLFGYSRSVIKIENDSFRNVISPAFSSVNKVKYANGAFSAGLGVDLRLNFSKIIGLNVKAQVLTDPSNKYWRRVESYTNPLDKNSPRTSLFNYSVSAGLSILIIRE